MSHKKKEFTAESGMGFMRAIQFGNVLAILCHLVIFFFVSGSDLKGALAWESFAVAVDIICLGEIIWLIAHRKKYTRQIAVVMYFISFVNTLITHLLLGTLNWTVVWLNAIMPVLLSLYFITSRRAKAVLVQPFDVHLHDTNLGKGKVMWNPKSVDFWMRLAIYFFVFSVAGHWMEMGVQLLVKAGIMPGTLAGPDSLTWRDSLNPFFIYGIAVVVCGLVLYPVYTKLKEKIHSLPAAYVTSFFINMAFCVIAELILGMLFNADHHAWDYSNQFLNFQGQICLLYSLCFGFLSSGITWYIYPLMERQWSYVSKDAFRVIFVASAVLFVFLYFAYNCDPYDLGILEE